jgi:hypothetical protein
MNPATPIKAADAINTYILAKDGNRPQLMRRAFAADCELTMAVKTDAVSFPSSAKGLDQITRVLITDFGDRYTNITTLCLSRPNSDHPAHFRCDWLVGMSAKHGGAVRVGCGHYSLRFAPDGRANQFRIDIEVMSVLPVDASRPIMSWLKTLPYPWCSHDQAYKSIPAIDGLRPIKCFLMGMERNIAAVV